jgi:citrate lyase beta subunit
MTPITIADVYVHLEDADEQLRKDSRREPRRRVLREPQNKRLRSLCRVESQL